MIAKFEGDTDKQLSLSLGESVYVINKKDEAGEYQVACSFKHSFRMCSQGTVQCRAYL